MLCRFPSLLLRGFFPFRPAPFLFALPATEALLTCVDNWPGALVWVCSEFASVEGLGFLVLGPFISNDIMEDGSQMATGVRPLTESFLEIRRF